MLEETIIKILFVYGMIFTLAYYFAWKDNCNLKAGILFLESRINRLQRMVVDSKDDAVSPIKLPVRKPRVSAFEQMKQVKPLDIDKIHSR